MDMIFSEKIAERIKFAKDVEPHLAIVPLKDIQEVVAMLISEELIELDEKHNDESGDERRVVAQFEKKFRRTLRTADEPTPLNPLKCKCILLIGSSAFNLILPIQQIFTHFFR